MSPMDELDLLTAIGSGGVLGALAFVLVVVWASTPVPFDWWIAAGLTGVVVVAGAMNVAVIVSVLRRP